MLILKAISLTYLLSSLFMIGVRAIVKRKTIKDLRNMSESQWMFQIFTPGLNTVNVFATIFFLLRSLVENNFYETWQIFPTVQYRKEPEDNCYFIVVVLPVFGSFVFRFERKVKETDDSHHAE